MWILTALWGGSVLGTFLTLVISKRYIKRYFLSHARSGLPMKLWDRERYFLSHELDYVAMHRDAVEWRRHCKQKYDKSAADIQAEQREKAAAIDRAVNAECTRDIHRLATKGLDLAALNAEERLRQSGY